MAMTTCKECKKEVSDSAKTCPHCGAKKPGERWWHALFGLVIMIAIGTWVYHYLGVNNKIEPSSAKDTIKITAEKQCAANDGNCLFEKYWIDASTPCKKLVEKSSKYDFEWTYGTFEPMFSRFLTGTKNQIVFVGDKVKLTNGFNAKTTMVYYCTFDFKTKKIVDFKIDSGRL